MPKFIVESNLKHDGESHAPGDEIELTNKKAEGLLASGVILPATKDKSFSQEEIVDAIAELDGDNKDLWTNDGAPKVPAIEAVLEGGITATQRDEAWATLNAY